MHTMICSEVAECKHLLGVWSVAVLQYEHPMLLSHVHYAITCSARQSLSASHYTVHPGYHCM